MQGFRKSKHNCFFIDGYSSQDIVYKWVEGTDAVKIYQDIAMSQFTLANFTYGVETMGNNHGTTVTSQSVTILGLVI